jgi:hypothetical protein
MVRSNTSNGMSRNAWNGQIPALLTNTSTLPKASSAAPTNAAALSGSATSALNASARRPSASISAVQASAGASSPM